MTSTIICPACGGLAELHTQPYRPFGVEYGDTRQIAVDRFTYREYYDRWRALERVLYMQRAQLLQKDLNQLRSNS